MFKYTKKIANECLTSRDNLLNGLEDYALVITAQWLTTWSSLHVHLRKRSFFPTLSQKYPVDLVISKLGTKYSEPLFYRNI